MEKTDIVSMLPDELEQYVTEMGERSFRAKQIFSWLHQKRAVSFDEMTNLPEKLRERLKEEAVIVRPSRVRVLESSSHDTKKFLFRLSDGNVIESVWMKHHHGNSVCISSQVGCRMGCRFCASTLGGCVRNLSASEILGQVYAIRGETGERISNIDMMGSGEPLDNYDETLRFLKLVSSPDGADFSLRNVTLSTCGLVPAIRRLAREHLQLTLAVSLHATNDAERREIMPVARQYPIEDLIGACRYYFHETGRRISFEYALIEGKNDTDRHASELAGLLRGMNCHVNLIPANPVRERNFRRSTPAEVRAFYKKLEKYGINVTIRREMGADIDGACGQLRQNYISENN
ncbi:MAG: 23S rRNA (adenine(2503)-C(2))-methyltransferase RlmN [Bilifractor sp.]|jgi:23S rRNA (adenine2503-C2)-methyltransferase